MNLHWIMLIAITLAACTAPAALPRTEVTETPASPIAATAIPAAAPAAPLAANAGRSVTLWAPYASSVEIATIEANAGLVDELNFVWYELVGGGRIRGGIGARQAMEAARRLGIRVLPSIANSGFNRDFVIAAIGTDEARSAHVADLVALVVDNGFEGIDIDYESLYAEDRELFSLFIEELGAALHAENKLLSIAVHAKSSEPGSWSGPQAQDWARLGAAVDFFKIMTYDFHYSTSEPGAIAPLAWVDEVLDFAATVVSPEKTYMGLHFYGYDWVGAQATSLEHVGVRKLIAAHSPELRRDEDSGETWFTYDDGRRTVYFADAQMVATRLAALAQDHPAVAGIAVWRIGGEDPEIWAEIRGWAGEE
jgi:spore germination protein YaaH